jgi:putative pyruvate formate lyase activating enzyme
MYRQTGPDLIVDEDGLLKRGLIIRLLVLPNDVASVEESVEWIKDELNPRVAISLMAQYYPTHQAESNKRFVLLSRRIRESEWMKATSVLEKLGMEEGWIQEFDGASYYYRPDFTDTERPFRDIRDFE